MRSAILALCLVAVSPAVLAQNPMGKDEPPDIKKYMRALTTKLLDRDPKVRMNAVLTLRIMGMDIKSAAGTLGWVLQFDNDPEVRRAAAEAITHIGPSAAEQGMGELLKALDNKDDSVRVAVLGSLAATAPFSKTALPKLSALAKDKNPQIRRGAMRALIGLAPFCNEVFAMAVPALDDPDKGEGPKDPGVNWYADGVFYVMGPAARAAGPLVAKIRGMDEAKLRSLDAKALAEVVRPDPKLVVWFVEVLKSDFEKNLRPSGAYALGSMGPAAKEAVYDLLRALDKADLEEAPLALRIKASAAWALGRIGPSAKAAIPSLTELAASKDELVRMQATGALKCIQASQ